MHIRHITESDTAAFLALCTQLDTETTLMMVEPGERCTTEEEQHARIVAIGATPNHLLLVAEEDGQLCGYIEAEGGAFRRNRHSAFIVIGVLQGYTGHGIGKALFTHLDAWARERGIHRLELTVQTHNTRALHLYQRMGFVTEGTRKDSLLVDGIYIDEYALAKLIEK